jgi:hypothetical protein
LASGVLADSARQRRENDLLYRAFLALPDDEKRLVLARFGGVDFELNPQPSKPADPV